MTLESLRLTAIIPGAPEDVYEAWLDDERHTSMTGGQATIDAHVGGRHTAWDGYIEGTLLALEPARRIEQTWRSLDFPEGSDPSNLEVLLSAVPGGTELTLIHTQIPEGQAADYEEGWHEHYFRPMQAYFAPRVARSAPKAAAKPKPTKVAVRKPVAKKVVESPKKKVAKKNSAPKKPAKPKSATKKALAKRPAPPHKKIKTTTRKKPASRRK